jgi:hypothetical protein
MLSNDTFLLIAEERQPRIFVVWALPDNGRFNRASMLQGPTHCIREGAFSFAAFVDILLKDYLS